MDLRLRWYKTWKRVFGSAFLFSLVLSCGLLPASNDVDRQSIAPTRTHTDQAFDTITPLPTATILPSTATPPPQSTPTEVISSPTPAPLPITRFAVIGDYGMAGDPERDVANLILSWNPAFIITTGDNNYPDGSLETIDANVGQYYHEFIHPYYGQYGDGAETNRFFPTLGNHDWNAEGARAYFEYFTLPGNERYYDFVWGSVHLFAVDSDSREPDGVGRSSIQASWLQERLANSTSPWKIVYMHQPPYASAGDGSIAWAQWPYKEWGASVVLGGHSHVYERIIMDDFPYFIVGLSGGPRYEFNMPVSGSQVRYNDDYGAMLIEATPEEITFSFYTRGNILIDTYSLEN